MGRLFKTGAKRSHPDKLAAATPAHEHPLIKARLAAHVSGASPLPDSVDLGGFWPSILDQNETGSCTAHAISCALYTTLAAQGKPLGFIPSPKAIYAAVRALEARNLLTQSPAILTDSGANLSDIMTILSTTGVKPMVAPSPGGFNSDVDTSNVNDEPQLQDLEASGQKLISGPYSVDMSASNLSDVLASSLASNMAIDNCFNCDDAFQALQSGQTAQAPVDAPDDGGHSTALTGYVTIGGVRYFWLTNSWSKNWATGGRVLLSPGFVSAIWECWPISVSSEGSIS
jgi:Papain family cysteine protease